MTRARLIAVALFAALPLAGCGNKGQLILNPEPQEMPPEVAASVASMAPPSGTTVYPAPAASVTPTPAASVAPPAATTTAPPADTDGTPGTPR